MSGARSVHRIRVAYLLAALLPLVGCGDAALQARRYRAERLLHEARQEEQRYRLAGHRDSVRLDQLRLRFGAIRAAVPLPPEAKPGSKAERIRVDLVRLVGNAELIAAGLAFEARKPADGVARAEWVFQAARPDTFLMREAELRVIDGLQALQRYDDALARMHGMLERYPPVPPRNIDEQDPILKMPELMVALRRELGDSAGARAEVRRSIEYFQGLRSRNPPPILEAQILVQEVRARLELDDRSAALAALDRLEALTRTNPELEKGRPEILFSRGRVESMRGGDYKAAVATFDEILKTYPASPFAARALLEAGVLLEGSGKHREALARYRDLLGRFGSDEGTASIALFRQAMLRDQLGDWAGAKQDLERLPVRYPRTRGALEAPFAVVQHYARAGDVPAMKVALLRAIETYKGLIAADSTSASIVSCRWNIARCYAGLDRWEDALREVDGMVEKHRGQPITGNALFEAARISERLGQKERARKYLQRFLADFPESPYAAQVRARLEVTARK
jgi:tetratricopeptide (TPR) repeat protein